MHMTCAQCKHEFCWLCLGDYKKHSAETGRYLCNSFEDVIASGVNFILNLKIIETQKWRHRRKDEAGFDAEKAWSL